VNLLFGRIDKATLKVLVGLTLKKYILHRTGGNKNDFAKKVLE
jgi:hypothetical protein